MIEVSLLEKIFFFLQVLTYVPRIMVDVINFAFIGETPGERALVHMAILQKMELLAWGMKVTCYTQEGQY